MALPITLFFRENRIYGMDFIVFDLLLTEQHNFDAAITDHPIEDGSEISDHIQNSLEYGNLTALITNFSISRSGILTNEAQDVFDSLVELWEAKTIMDIWTVMKVYEDVAISSMPIARDADTGEAIIIQVSFKKVKFVTLQEISLELSVKVNNLNTKRNRQIAARHRAGATVAGP